MSAHEFDWTKLAFANKKAIKQLNAIFIAAPRELSPQRCKQLVKAYLPKGNIVLGIAKEPFIEGFDNQPQFKTLKKEVVQPIIEMVNASPSKNKLFTLEYFQRDITALIEKIPFKQAVFVNGSWKYAFHHTPTYYNLINSRTPYNLVSPFASEAEAKAYADMIEPDMLNRLDLPDKLPREKALTPKDMLTIAHQAAKLSFDYNFQTGAAIGTRVEGTKNYKLMAFSCNEVVPYRTYAMHSGASRETYFSPPNDLNHYDTVHAEVNLLLDALQLKIDLEGTTLFINLMPCPACARMIARTNISEIVYELDHSDGYAVKLLERAGKKVRRVVL